MSGRAERVATIDVGTSSILLLIVERGADGRLVVVDDRCRIEGLGRGVDRTGRLQPDAIARGLAAITEYADAVRAAGVARVGVVGTQALREAANGAEFLAPAEALLGARVEVISGDREARLVLAGVRDAFPELAGGRFVVCDVGGGSTELISATASALETVISVPIGSVRLAERFLASDPPRSEELAAMITFIDEALAPVALGTGPLVATAGTATTIAAIAQGLEPFDPAKVAGYRVPRAELERQLARLAEVTLAERRGVRGLAPQRADTIVAGAAILVRVLARAGADEMIVSDRGVRWGLAAELAAAGP